MNKRTFTHWQTINIRVRGKDFNLPLNLVSFKTITIKTRLAYDLTLPLLFKIVQADRFDLKRLITPQYSWRRELEVYDTNEQASANRALKVIFSN